MERGCLVSGDIFKRGVPPESQELLKQLCLAQKGGDLPMTEPALWEQT